MQPKDTIQKCIRFLITSSLLSTAIFSTTHAHAFFSYTAQNKSITDLVAQSGGEFDHNDRDFDVLLNAVTAAGLADALAAPEADLTVLAPNDRAFIRLAQDLGFEGNDEAGAFNAIVTTLTELGNGDPIPVLTNVLLYHVSPEKKGLRRLATSRTINTLLDGQTITPDFLKLVDNEPDVNNPRYTFPINLRANNGVIHAIDRVLIPLDLPGNGTEPTQNIVDIVAASDGVFDRDYSDFDILLNAVQAANLVDALAAVDADLTVFAPNDAAFVRLARDLGYRGFSEQGAFEAIVATLTELGAGDPIPVLTNVLLYHVSPQAKTVKQVSDLDTVVTLLEGEELEPYGVFLLDAAEQLRSPKIDTRKSNIRATNGIIHVLNRVLIPVNITPARRFH